MAEKNSVEIKDITIKLGDVDVRLSVEQAKCLRRLLNDLLENDRYVYIPYYPNFHTYSTYPYWTVTTSGNSLSINSTTEAQ